MEADMARCRYYYDSRKSEDIFHKENEDYMMHSRFSFMNDVSVDVVALADGMGGLERGGRASHTVVFGFLASFYENLMKEYVPRRRNFTISHYCDKVKEALQQAFVTANSRVCQEMESGIQSGTTLSVLVMLGDYLLVANVGDSPVYYYSKQTQEMQILSTLQTKAEQDYLEGRYERFGEAYYQNDYILTHYMGEYDPLPVEHIALHIVEQIQPGDMLLIASDGAVGQRSPGEILDLLQSGEPERALGRLFEKAGQDKADDQTAVWIQVD